MFPMIQSSVHGHKVDAVFCNTLFRMNHALFSPFYNTDSVINVEDSYSITQFICVGKQM